MQKKRFYKDYTLLANPSLPLEAGPKREREKFFDERRRIEPGAEERGIRRIGFGGRRRRRRREREGGMEEEEEGKVCYLCLPAPFLLLLPCSAWLGTLSQEEEEE